jgi:hypothetical protein
MSGRRARFPVSDTTAIVIRFAARAANSVPHSKILISGALAALLVVVAVPILFRVDMPPVAASSPLKCYDSAGKYEPCLMQAGASRPQLDDRATEAHQPANWTTTALYQQASLAPTEPDQPASWATSAPAAQRSGTPGKRPALAVCGQRFIPCFFSALRRGLTHIASAAANVGRARPAREHL